MADNVGDTTHGTPDDRNLRALPRVPCQIAVSSTSRSAPIGDIVDISLDGARLTSTMDWAEGAILPLVFCLGEGGHEITVRAQVVRQEPPHFGVKFVDISDRDARRLRRYVGGLNAVVSHREAIARLHDADVTTTTPIKDAKRISALLQASIGNDSFRVIPATRAVKEESKLIRVEKDSLLFRSTTPVSLQVGEDVFIIYTLDFVTHSFQTSVIVVDGSDYKVAVPHHVLYSEKRTNERTEPLPNSLLEIRLPWKPGETSSFPLVDISASGLSFRSEAKTASFWPNTVLEGAILRVNGEETLLLNPTVRRVSSSTNDEGVECLIVGLSHGIGRTSVEAKHSELQVEAEAKKHKVFAWSRDLVAKVSYLYHTKFGKIGKKTADAPFRVVRFSNTRGQQVVGLLNMPFKSKTRVRAPLILIAPGFANRKEALSALAMTIVANFRRLNRDIAVLRFDGTNNLGESYKDPGCEGEGKNLLHYTVSNHMSDVLGGLKWAQSNRFVDPTDIIVISVSFASIAVRRSLTLPEAANVSRWICFMGAADAQSAMVNGSGNIDAYGNFLRGVKTGTVSLLGCMSDGDYSCADMHQLKVATIEDARRDMAKIKASVSWFVGKQDAIMDIRRVRDVMTVSAPGSREVIEVNSGHVPTSSDEAMSQFALITGQIYKHLYGQDREVTIPSRGWLGAIAKAEWDRVRSQKQLVQKDYWRNYLLGEDDGLGFDLIYMTDEYKQLIVDQIALLNPSGLNVLDVGAGTGNISFAVAKQQPKNLTCVDLVPEALERLKRKLAGSFEVKTHAVNLDGSAKIAMRQWLAGTLPNLEYLSGRVPSLTDTVAKKIMQQYTPSLHAYLRGVPLDLVTISRDANLPSACGKALLEVHTLARLVQGRVGETEAESVIGSLAIQAMKERPGLPFPDDEYDAVVCSLVLSYMDYPTDTLSEIYRVLKPGGRLVISTMLPDADTSKGYLDTIKLLETVPEEHLPYGLPRQKLLDGARAFMNKIAELMLLEEEGQFCFWSGAELAQMVTLAGFEVNSITPSCGAAPQAVIVDCSKPNLTSC